MNKKTNSSVITVILVLGMFISTYGQYQLAAVPGSIYQLYQLNDVQFSGLMTASMIPSIFLGVLMGVIADRFGLKRIISISLIISIIGFVLRCFASDYAAMFLAMTLTGFASAVFSANLSKIVACVYPAEKMGKMVGVLMTGMTGSMLAAYATTAFIPSVEIAFWIAAAICILTGVLWIFLTKDSDFQKHAESEDVPLRESFGVCLRSKNTWLLGLSLMFLFGGGMVVSNFQVAALTTLKGYSQAYAGTFGTVLMIGALIGAALMPAYVIGNKKAPVILLVSGVIAGIAMLAIPYTSAPCIYIGSFLNGVLRGGMISILTAFPVMFPEIGSRYAGTSGGFAVTLQMIGGVVIPTYIIVPLGNGSMSMYFVYGMISMLICSVLAFVVAGATVKKE